MSAPSKPLAVDAAGSRVAASRDGSMRGQLVTEVPVQPQTSDTKCFAPGYYECAICSDILLDPVVGSCGHDFCRGCLEHWREQSQQNHTVPMCPICRRELTDKLGVCHRLQGIVESCFPEQIAKRRAEVEKSTTEAERRRQQFYRFQATVAAQYAPFPPDQPTREAGAAAPVVSAPDLSAFAAAQLSALHSTQSSLDSAFLFSTWEQDQASSHPQASRAHPRTCPILSTPSSHSVGKPAPATMLNLPSSTQTAWWSGLSSLPTADSGLVSTGADAPSESLWGVSTPRTGADLPHFATPPRLPVGAAVASSSAAALPPLPPRPHPAAVGNYATCPDLDQRFAEQSGRLGRLAFPAQQLAAAPLLDCFMDSDATGVSEMSALLRQQTLQQGGHTLSVPLPDSAASIASTHVVPEEAFPFHDSTLSTPRASRQPSTSAFGQPPHTAPRPHTTRLTTRASDDGCLLTPNADYFGVGHASHFMLQPRQETQRRTSEPGECRPGPERAVMLLASPPETKYSSAIKRMREEDDAADAAGRPRTSAMRRLFAPDGSATRTSRPAFQPLRIPSASTQEAAPVAVRRGVTSILDNVQLCGNMLPAANSISAPVSAYSTAAGTSFDLARLAASYRTSSQPEHWAALHQATVLTRTWRRATHDGAVDPAVSARQAISQDASTATFLDSATATPCTRHPSSVELDVGPAINTQTLEADGCAFVTDADCSTPRHTHARRSSAMDAQGSAATTPRNQNLSTPNTVVTPMDTAPSQQSPPDAANASPGPPLPSFARTQAASIGNSMPSILRLATPVRVPRLAGSGDSYSRTCPNTPRARQVEAASPFTPSRATGSALIAALMLPPPPPGSVAARVQPPVPRSGQPVVSTPPPAASPVQIWSLQELMARGFNRPSPPAQPWHNKEQDRPVRSACSSALAAFFTERFSQQLDSQPPGAVFLYVKTIEEHLYYNTASKAHYADLSTLQERMIQAVDELIAVDPPSSNP